MAVDSVNIKYKDNPVMLDLVLDNMRQQLLERLPWLDYAFGRAYKLVRHTEEGKFTEPMFYKGNGEYVSLMPNDNWGNFCWFDIYDPQSIDTTQRNYPKLTFSGAIVFWYNMERIFNDAEFLYNEEIKQQVVNALSTPGIITQRGHVQVFDIYERLENIYKGYSLEKVYNTFVYSGQELTYIDKQYFMHPYAGLRIELAIDITSNPQGCD